jgi:SpoVK/Ycf46/Vps4 family AAA+-type ATPase
VAQALKSSRRRISDDDLFVACRAEIELDMGELAQMVTPRFEEEELILPHSQALQFQEILTAMRSLTEVHYGWGTAKVWNESGISILFAGPPGTGKTMAAEILAIRLGLPMYRIDLSQVADKYIGETEKNLKRLFDAADVSDTILFFDEADALFGRRTQVRDAHDRYANLEISYLLERMERFKGLAILATNRKKDIDEAFLRRLRYILDFPLPGVEERSKIWRQVIPRAVDASELDVDFLAARFPLAGGHIRSIVFNACLQSANGSARRARKRSARLRMDDVLVAVKREYDKLNRSISLEQFGPHAQIVRGLEVGP